MESSSKAKNIKLKILFDSKDTDSFIYPHALDKCGLVACKQNDFTLVKMASGEQQLVGLSVEECIVNLGVCSIKLKVYVTALGTYDLIIGMDWLESH